ncbi:MAG: hypothetical protein AAF587_29150 [Bacteroidota bacterium]
MAQHENSFFLGSSRLSFIVAGIWILATLHPLSAQPGTKEYPFCINQLYDQALNPIDPGNKNLDCHLFILKDTSLYADIVQEVYGFQPFTFHEYLYRQRGINIGPDYLLGRRLWIVYKQDTMVVDLHGVQPTEVPFFYSILDFVPCWIDSLVFRPGYLRVFLDPTPKVIKKGIHVYFPLIKQGLTPYTIPKLEFMGACRHSNYLAQVYPIPERLPGRYYFARGHEKIRESQRDDALTDFEIALEKGLEDGALMMETQFQIARIFAYQGKNDEAIDILTELISRFYSHESGTEFTSFCPYFSLRKSLYERLGKNDLAEKDDQVLDRFNCSKNRMEKK